jgi:hypothetical protein
VILDTAADNTLREFLRESNFHARGGIVSDLDGTAVLEERGRIYIPESVEFGLKRLVELKRPFVINSLRFPLSVLRTFGREWYSIANAPIPTVSLNGSLLGYVTKTDDELAFEELEAFPLSAEEIDEVLAGVQGLIAGAIKNLLVFYYPRDWRMGEIIWTPVPENVMHVKDKYASASAVTAVEIDTLREQMCAASVCMIFLLIDVPEDKLMAYQHVKRSSFVTRQGVDKLSGWERMAGHLGLDVRDSIGAGDTPMDRFLSGVGLAVHVGNLDLEFKGISRTIKLRDSHELGALLFRAAELQEPRA